MALCTLTENRQVDPNRFQAEESYGMLYNHAVSVGTLPYPVLIKGLKSFETRYLDIFEKNCVLNKGALGWAKCFSFITTSGTSHTQTLKTPGNERMSFIAAAAANKGKEGVCGKIIKGGIGDSSVTIHFKSCVEGAWKIFVLVATDDAERRAIT